MRREKLGLLDRDRAHEDGLALLALLDDLLDDGLELLALGPVDEVVLVDADHVAVRRDHDDVELVDLVELGGFRVRRARHARELVVHPEVVLERDRGERLVLFLDLDALLRLDRLMEAVRPAASRHEPARELVHDEDLAVPDDVGNVPLVERVRAKRLLAGVEDVDVRRVVEVLDAEEALALRHALLGQRGRVRPLVEEVVAGRRLVSVLVLDLLALDELRDDPVHLVVDVRLALGRARDDERRPRLVDEDRVDFVHDGEDVPALDHLRELELHVVAQVVEAELVVRAERDVARVGVAALLVGHVVLDAAHREPEELVDAAHPLGVAAREVVVHGDEVGAAAREGVERDGERRDERLALARAHLGDLALVEDHAAHELDVVVALSDRAPRGLAHEREDLDELLVEDLAGKRAPLLELRGKVLQALLDARADLGDARADPRRRRAP